VIDLANEQVIRRTNGKRGNSSRGQLRATRVRNQDVKNPCLFAGFFEIL